MGDHFKIYPILNTKVFFGLYFEDSIRFIILNLHDHSVPFIRILAKYEQKNYIYYVKKFLEIQLCSFTFPFEFLNKPIFLKISMFEYNNIKIVIRIKKRVLTILST